MEWWGGGVGGMVGASEISCKLTLLMMIFLSGGGPGGDPPGSELKAWVGVRGCVEGGQHFLR